MEKLFKFSIMLIMLGVFASCNSNKEVEPVKMELNYTSSLQDATAEEVIRNNNDLLNNYLTIIAKATFELMEDQDFKDACKNTAYSSSNLGDESDFYAPLIEVSTSIGGVENLMDRMRASLIANGASSSEIEQFNSLGLKFTINGVQFQPRLFLPYLNTEFYGVMNEETYPVIG
jgi:hypothetical protein